MSLTVLILASEMSHSENDGLRAAFSLAGRTLLERQAECAQDVGATRFLILVATLPQELTAAMDRIAARGGEVIPVRSASEIFAQIKDDDQILLIADGLCAPPTCYKALTEVNAPAVLATPDNQAARDLERIDAQTRWAGLALVPRSVFADLAHISDDWDVGSTLLRQTIQAQARRIMCEPIMFERGEIAVLTNSVEASLVTARMLQQAEFGGEGLGKQALFSPFARLVGPVLLSRNIPTTAFFGSAAALLLVGLVSAFMDQPFWASIAGILASISFALGEFQQLFTKTRSGFAKLKRLGEWLAFLFPVAIISPVLKQWPWQAETLYLGALSLILMLLWRVGKALFHLQNDDAPRSDIFLSDPEIFFVILAISSIIGFPMMALPVASLLAACGILIWLIKPSK